MTVLCACGTLLDESHPAAITAHASTPVHQAWLDAKYGEEQPIDPPQHLPKAGRKAWYASRAEREDTMTNPIDALVDDPRNDPRLNDTAFIGTDEGQALVAAAQAADREARLASKRAAEKARRERIKANHGVETRPEVYDLPVGSPLATEIAAAQPKPEPKVVKSAVPANHPLTLGPDPIDVKGVMQYPVLRRDGTISASQTDNWDWHCPKCGKRLRDADCDNGHKPFLAPPRYRRSDRIVK